MGERIWSKFHPLFGPDLKVGFETTFPKEVMLKLDPLYEKSGLVHESSNEPVRRIYEPAYKILGSCLNSNTAQVFFEPVPALDSLFRRLVFARRVKQKPRWMVAARHGELFHFGFDSFNARSERYLSLAYTGLSEQFIPVYVKIQNGKEGFIFLEIWAWSEKNGKVVVQARKVEKKEAPVSLYSAKP